MIKKGQLTEYVKGGKRDKDEPFKGKHPQKLWMLAHATKAERSINENTSTSPFSLEAHPGEISLQRDNKEKYH